MSHKKTSRVECNNTKCQIKPRTLLEVKEAIRGRSDITKNERHDMVWAINRVGDTNKLPGEASPDAALSRMEACPRQVCKFLDRKLLQDGSSERGTLNNIKSLVPKALRTTGADPRVGNRGAPLSPLWSKLFDQLPQLPYQASLGAFVRYLDPRGIAPEEVDSLILERFGDFLKGSSLRRCPRTTLLAARRAWNAAAENFPEFWPQTALTLEYKFDRYSLGWEAFDPALLVEAKQRTAVIMDPELDDEDAGDAVCQETAKSQEYDIRRFASALAMKTNRPPKSIKSIGDLVEIDAAKAILTFLLERAQRSQPNAKSTSGIYVASQLLCTLAEHWVKVDKDHLERLRRMAAKRNPHRTAGGKRKRKREMTKKNRETLGAFHDEHVVARFLDLPEKIFQRILKKDKLRRSDAVKLGVAFAIAMLQIAPVRPKNAANAELGVNITEHGKGKHRRVFARWSEEEVKNGVELEFEFTGLTLELFDKYVTIARRLLAGPKNMYLFPGRGENKAKQKGHFSTQIANFLEDELRERVTGQQFRHVIGFIYLCENPGDYETVRQFLGHTHISTTVNFYAGMEMKIAAKTLDGVISKRRAELSRLTTKPRRKGDR